MPRWWASSWTTVMRTSSARSSGSAKSSSSASRNRVIRFGAVAQSAPYSVLGTPSYRPYSMSSEASSLSRRWSAEGSSSMRIATSASASRNGAGIPARARATSRSNGAWRVAGRWNVARDPRRRFGMAAYRSRMRAPSRPDPAADPPGFVVVVEPGDRIHFQEWGGDGTPGVLLVHGLGATSWVWAPVARRLIAVRRTVAMDLRGHGLSDAPTESGAYDLETLGGDAVAVAEGSGLLDDPADRVVVAGHGFGAIVAAVAAARLGARCMRLVLVDGGLDDLAISTGLDIEEFLRGLDEPPAVMASMAAWLADRRGFDPATWDTDQER